MHLARPTLRPWRILAAVVFAYLVAGLLYGVGRELHTWWLVVPRLPQGASVDNVVSGWGGLFFLSAMHVARTAIMTLTSLGLPYLSVRAEETTNLYPIILPTALILLALATRTLRLGHKESKAELSASYPPTRAPSSAQQDQAEHPPLSKTAVTGSAASRRSGIRLRWTPPMHVARPSLRPWRILTAIFLAYPVAGLLYGMWHTLQMWLAPEPPGSHVTADLMEWGLFLDGVYMVRMVIMAVTTLGFPYRFVDSEETINLYPIILPTALIFLALMTRALRFGHKVGKTELSA